MKSACVGVLSIIVILYIDNLNRIFSSILRKVHEIIQMSDARTQLLFGPYIVTFAVKYSFYIAIFTTSIFGHCLCQNMCLQVHYVWNKKTFPKISI